MAGMPMGPGMPHHPPPMGHHPGGPGSNPPPMMHGYTHAPTPPGPGQQMPPHNAMGQGPPQQHPPPQQQVPQNKELNASMLCRFGQETVQEIVARSSEMFQFLRTTQPPDGKMNAGMDRKTKFQDTLKTIKSNFKRLRVIYEKIEENFPSSKDNSFEEDILNKSDDNLTVDDKRNTESYKLAVEEYKEVMEHVMIKNRQLKDAIDHLRTMIWDVNTMLAMRKE